MSTRTEYPNFIGNTGKFLKVNATETDVLWDAVDASDITGVLGIDHGGTGADNANDALNNLLPDQTGNAGEALFTDGIDTYWAPASSGGVDTRVYTISALVMQTTSRTVYAGLLGSANNQTIEAPVLSPFHENVVVKDIYFFIASNTCNEDAVIIVRKNGVDTGASVTVPAGVTGNFAISVNEPYAANDNFSVRGTISGTATGTVQVGGVSAPGNPGMNVIVQVSGGSPLGVQSVTGLNTNNTDPFNPIVQISVDGVTVTGDGTPGNPLVSTGGIGGVDTRVYSTGSGALSFNPALGDRFAGLASISSGTEAPILAAFGDNVIVKRVMFQVYTGTVNDIIYATLRKNGVDTSTVMAIPALAANQVLSFNVNESYSSTDQYSIKLASAGTGSLVFTNVETIVQVSGGSPLGVQSVSGNGVNNTDPFNPIVRTANTTTEGTLTAADWNTFNNKQNALPTLCVVKAYKNLLGGAASPFIADTEVFDTTSSYDNTTGIFTAPRTGYYLITASFSVEGHSTDPSIASVQVIKNGSAGIDQDSIRFNGTEGASDYWKRRLKVSTTTNLTAGDTIEFNVSINTGTMSVTGGVEGNQITISELR